MNEMNGSDYGGTYPESTQIRRFDRQIIYGFSNLSEVNYKTIDLVVSDLVQLLILNIAFCISLISSIIFKIVVLIKIHKSADCLAIISQTKYGISIPKHPPCVNSI
jgi:hypothetical protein